MVSEPERQSGPTVDVSGAGPSLDAPATDHYRIVVSEPARPQRWFRGLGVLIAHVAGWFEGFGSGPVNPGGRPIDVVDVASGEVVLAFVEEFGDDKRFALATLQQDLDEQTVGDFRAKWL